MENILKLKPGREKSLLRRHPWIFSGAVERVSGTPARGETLIVESAQGEFLGRCGYNPQSSIRGRMWTFGDEEINAEFFHQRLRQAIGLREAIGWLSASNSAARLVHAESDGLPGLIVDRYEDYLVVQFLTAAIETWKKDITQTLKEITGVMNIYERSDADVRNLEGLEELSGILIGAEPPERVQIVENGLCFLVDIRQGQKTGFYLDQRENRAALRGFAQGKSVLNCFSYTGGFTAYALAAGAEQVLSIDASQEANILAEENLLLNNLDAGKADFICGDVFKELRLLRDAGRQFDLIVLDPPKFAATAAQVNAAARGYKDINLLAFKLLKPGGTLFTFSCSGGIRRELFQKIVADAALDAGAEAGIIGQLSQGADHPIALNFPEGEYLKGLICRKVK